MDTSDLSKNDLVRRYDNLRASIRRVREHSKHGAKIGLTGVLATGGGALSGYMSVNSSLQKLPGTNVPSDFALGTALMIGAALDMFDAQNENVAAFAGGLLAAAAARETQRATLAHVGTK